MGKVIEKKKSEIVVKKIAKSKKKLDLNKSEASKDKIVNYLTSIANLFQEIETNYSDMMHQGGIAEDDSAKGLDVATDIGNQINSILVQIEDRVKYSNSRINQIEQAWETSASENKQYLARRIQELGAELNKVKSGQKADTDQS